MDAKKCPQNPEVMYFAMKLTTNQFPLVFLYKLYKSFQLKIDTLKFHLDAIQHGFL